MIYSPIQINCADNGLFGLGESQGVYGRRLGWSGWGKERVGVEGWGAEFDFEFDSGVRGGWGKEVVHFSRMWGYSMITGHRKVGGEMGK